MQEQFYRYGEIAPVIVSQAKIDPLLCRGGYFMCVAGIMGWQLIFDNHFTIGI